MRAGMTCERKCWDEGVRPVRLRYSVRVGDDAVTAARAEGWRSSGRRRTATSELVIAAEPIATRWTGVVARQISAV